MMFAAVIFLLVVACVALVTLVIWKLRPGISHGSAGFGPWQGTVADTLASLQPGLVLGKTQDGKLAGWSDEGHWLVIAPTGAGKSTGVLAPSIVNWQGSLAAIDIKGELARMCAPALTQAGIECVRIDPFDALGDDPLVRKVGIDPLRQAKEDKHQLEGYKALAEILIDPPGANDAHWAESARVVVAGLVAACSAARYKDNATMGAMNKVATLGYKSFRQFARREWPPEVEAAIQPALSLVQGAGKNERGAIFSTLRRQLDFLANAAVASTLNGNWRPQELFDGKKPVALFIVLPPERLDTQSRFLRLVLGCVVQAMLQAGTDRERRLLLVVDEAAALGNMEAITRGVSLFRGFGAHFLLSFQDLAQLDATYGQDVATSIQANCHALYWGCRDQATCEKVSAILGEETVLALSREIAAVPLSSKGATSERETGRRLLTADEIRRLPEDTMLALLAGQRPSKLELIRVGDKSCAQVNYT